MKKPKLQLFTVGYESCEIDDFADQLKKKRIRMVADVRKNPVSRKRGFSKNKMAQNLALRKIEYVHLPTLGVPTEWRKQAKAHVITREKMFRDYVKKVLPAGHPAIEQLRELMREKRLALLCYEADASDCHRHYVAEEIQKQEKGKVEILDLDFKCLGRSGISIGRARTSSK